MHPRRRQRLALCRYIIIGMGIVTMLTSPFMKMDSVAPENEQAQQPAKAFGFFHEKLFWLTTIIMLCYQHRILCDGLACHLFYRFGAASESSARYDHLALDCHSDRALCLRADRQQIHPAAIHHSCQFRHYRLLIVVLLSPSFAPLLIGTIGLGLCMAGMYGTTVSNATEIFKQYPLAMGVFATITNIGSVVAPSVIGAIAGQYNMRIGLSVLLVPAVLLIAFALYNFKKHDRIS